MLRGQGVAEGWEWKGDEEGEESLHTQPNIRAHACCLTVAHEAQVDAGCNDGRDYDQGCRRVLWQWFAAAACQGQLRPGLLEFQALRDTMCASSG
jgi:hypothetical protein